MLKDKYNYGLAILRIWMSFEVVLDHYWIHENDSGFSLLFSFFGGIAVPVFMIMSFYLTERKIICGELKWMRKRLYKLILPYILSAVFIFAVYTLLDKVYGRGLTSGWGDLWWQLLLGSSKNINPPLWFQFDMIVWLLVLFTICHIQYKNIDMMIWMLLIVSIIIQYTGINYNIFCNFRYEIRYPLGRLLETHYHLRVVGYCWQYTV